MKRTALLVTVTVLLSGAALGTAASASSRAAAGTWASPSTVASAGRYGGQADVAVARDGRAVAVWTRSARRYSGDTLLAAVRPAGGTWSAPVELAPRGPGHEFPSVALDANGAATVVWQDFDDRGHVRVLARRISPAGVVSRPVRLGRLDGGGGLPSLAVDPAGNATVAWTAQDRARTWVEVARRPAGGSWSDPVRLSPRDGSAGLPTVAASEGGTVVAWPGAATYDGVVSVYASRLTGGRWHPAERVSAGGAIFGVDVAVTPAGDVLATWSRYPRTGASRVEVAERPAGRSWQPARWLDPGEEGLDPVVAAGADGAAVVAWRSFDADDHSRVAAAVRTAAGSWGEVGYLSAPGGSVRHPHAVLDAGGVATIAWEDRGTGRAALAARHDPAVGWLPAERLSEAGERAAGPVLDVEADGVVTAVWTRVDGANRVRAATGPRRG